MKAKLGFAVSTLKSCTYPERPILKTSFVLIWRCRGASNSPGVLVLASTYWVTEFELEVRHADSGPQKYMEPEEGPAQSPRFRSD